MYYLLLVIKGFIVGIAFIIPGLSGGTLAMYLGIYEKLLHAIGNIFKEFKESLKFLVPLFFGIGISVVALAKLLGYLIDKNSLVVLLFFMGLVLGGAKDIYLKAQKDKKQINLFSVIAFVVSFGLIMLLVVFGKINSSHGIDYININFWNIILLVILGMAASITMIVPGISGSALLVVLGFYTAIVTNVVGRIFDFSNLTYNLEVIIPFAIGAAAGIIVFSRFIEKSLKNYPKQTYFAILGFIVASVIAIFFEIKDPTTGISHEFQTPIYKDLWNFLGNNVLSLVGGIALFVVGFFATKYMSQLEFKKISKG